MRKFVCKPLPGDASDPQGLTALLDRYLLWLETHHYASGTVKVRRVTLSQFLRWCLERSVTRPHDVTLEMLERFQRHVYFYRQRNGQPLSLSSQSHRLTSLRRWFAWLVRQRILEHDPAHDLQLPRDEQRLPRHPLSVREVEAVLAQADLTTPHGLRNRAILEVLYSTGLRRDEALGAGTHGSGPRARHAPRAQRQREEGSLRADRRAGPRVDRQVPGRSAAALGARAETPLVFVSKNGHRLHANQLSKIVRDYLRAAGIAKPGACHLFRHTTATLMLEAGADVRYIQALSGPHAPLHDADLHARLDHQAAGSAPAHASRPLVSLARRATTSGDRPSRRGRRQSRVGAGGINHLAGRQLLRVARPTRSAVPHRLADKISLPCVPGIGYNQCQFFDMLNASRARARDCKPRCVSAATWKPLEISVAACTCPAPRHRC